MEKIKQIKLIEQPREDIRLSMNEEASLFGGYYCPGTFSDGGFFGGDFCSLDYSSNGSCGGASYCNSFKECTFYYEH